MKNKNEKTQLTFKGVKQPTRAQLLKRIENLEQQIAILEQKRVEARLGYNKLELQQAASMHARPEAGRKRDQRFRGPPDKMSIADLDRRDTAPPVFCRQVPECTCGECRGGETRRGE